MISSAAALVSAGNVVKKLPLVPRMMASSCALVMSGTICCRFAKARLTKMEPATDRPSAIPSSWAVQSKSASGGNKPQVVLTEHHEGYSIRHHRWLHYRLDDSVSCLSITPGSNTHKNLVSIYISRGRGDRDSSYSCQLLHMNTREVVTYREGLCQQDLDSFLQRTTVDNNLPLRVRLH